MYHLVPVKHFIRKRGLYYFLGCYLAAKWGYQTLSGLSEAFKTYVLPLMWQRNFKEEYGEWAGKFCQKICQIEGS